MAARADRYRQRPCHRPPKQTLRPRTRLLEGRLSTGAAQPGGLLTLADVCDELRINRSTTSVIEYGPVRAQSDPVQASPDGAIL